MGYGKPEKMKIVKNCSCFFGYSSLKTLSNVDLINWLFLSVFKLGFVVRNFSMHSLGKPLDEGTRTPFFNNKKPSFNVNSF